MKEKLKPYLQALPELFNYQIVTKILLGVWLFLFRRPLKSIIK